MLKMEHLLKLSKCFIFNNIFKILQMEILFSIVYSPISPDAVFGTALKESILSKGLSQAYICTLYQACFDVRLKWFLLLNKQIVVILVKWVLLWHFSSIWDIKQTLVYSLRSWYEKVYFHSYPLLQPFDPWDCIHKAPLSVNYTSWNFSCLWKTTFFISM